MEVSVEDLIVCVRQKEAKKVDLCVIIDPFQQETRLRTATMSWL